MEVYITTLNSAEKILCRSQTGTWRTNGTKRKRGGGGGKREPKPGFIARPPPPSFSALYNDFFLKMIIYHDMSKQHEIMGMTKDLMLEVGVRAWLTSCLQSGVYRPHEN